MNTINSTVDKIVSSLKLSDDQLCDYLNLPTEEWEKFSGDYSEVGLFNLYKLAENLGLDYGNFIDGKIDYEVLKAKFLKSELVLPQKYLENASSRVRMAQAVLNFLSTYSFCDKQKIMSKLQISESALLHPESQINVGLIDDIYKEVMKLGYTDQFFISIAKKCAIDFKNSLGFYRSFKGVVTAQELFERFFLESIKYLDQNWNYHIVHSCSRRMVIKVETSERIQDDKSLYHFGSWGFTMHRIGIVKGLYSYIDQRELQVELLKTIHAGEDYCLYEIKYPA